MTDPDDDLRQAIALFRYGVIADLVHLPLGTKGIGDKLRDKAGQPYTIPGTDRTRVAADTIRGWIKLYRDGGFDALYPKPRTDRGQPRRLPPEVAERLVALKTENPACSVRIIIGKARAEGIDQPLAPSTVHRLFSREGLFDRAPPDGADRRRFAFRDAGELWMSDVMHGPKVRHGRSRRKSYLVAFIDDATRVIPFAAFAGAENVQAFLPIFKNALIRRGLPQRLYVDNGANYRSRQLALVCARLGIVLVHARPYQPAGKGKIERFFRTLRAGWLSHLDTRDLDSLQTLNRSLWAWIEGEYHNTPHRGLDGRAPLEQWALASAGVRYPDAGGLGEAAGQASPEGYGRAVSDGCRDCARRTSPSWSTTRGSSSCPGSRSPTSARTSLPSSAGACPTTGPSAITPRPCSSRPLSRGRDTLAPSTGPPVGSMSEPPKDAADTTGTGSTTSRKRTSGSGPSEEIRNAPSTARICGIGQTRHGLTEHLPFAASWAAWIRALHPDSA